MIIGGEEVLETVQDGIITAHIEKEDPTRNYTWARAVVHSHSAHMTRWCIKQGLEYGDDYHIQTFRLRNHNENSHFWYFKDREVATLFAFQFR
jgi:hypothetical protein